jgi:hypothetical protein
LGLKVAYKYYIGMAQKIEINNRVNQGATKLSAPNTMPLKYVKDEEGNFVCPHPGCGFTKKNQSTLHYHMKKHEEQLDYTCKTCKKQFLQKQTLDLHIRSKHPELADDTDEKKFKCPFNNCDFKALTKGNCVIHCLRVHFQDEINEIMIKDEETKMIYCNECQKEFSSSTAFYYHCKNCLTLDPNDEKVVKLQGAF